MRPRCDDEYAQGVEPAQSAGLESATSTPSQPSPKGCVTASHGPGSVGGATIKLREAKPGPSKPVIAVLKDLLAMAERGEVLAFAGVADLRGHETATAHCEVEGGNISNLVCGLERIKLRLLRIGGDDEP